MKRAKPLSNLSPQVLTVVNSPSFIEHDAGGEVAMLDRLIGSKQMASVWDEVNSLSTDDYFPLEFLQLALVLPRLWRITSKVPTGEAKKTLRDVEETARRLARQLLAHRREFILLGVYATDMVSLVLQVLEENGRSKTAKRLRKLNNSERDGNDSLQIPDLPAVLGKLADMLKAGQGRRRPVGYRPTKPQAKNAERTYCVKELIGFFEMHDVGELPLDVVARTVNAILDLRDPLTSDYVARLIRS